MPDALSRTIPIWCAVLNRLLFPTLTTHHALYTPPNVVSPSENAQITALLPTFLLSLRALNLPVADLQSKIQKPLRPMWVTPETEILRTEEMFADYHPVICCTVSRRVEGGEGSEGGYIQGAGDDTENWAHGLTPRIFWANKKLLLSTDESELPDVIERLVGKLGGEVGGGGGMRGVVPCERLFVGPISAVESQANAAITVVLTPKVTDKSTWHTSPTRMDIGLGHSKLGSRNLRTALPSIISFLDGALSTSTAEARKIIIACETGKDHSIGVALVVLCLFCDEKGELQGRRGERVHKEFIRERMGWIGQALPDANPARATLQSVNAVLMARD